MTFKTYLISARNANTNEVYYAKFTFGKNEIEAIERFSWWMRRMKGIDVANLEALSFCVNLIS